MVDRFFFCAQQVDSYSKDSPSITLLSGPPSCGKTSLLFQFAYNCALNSASSNRPGIEPSSDVFRHIQMKYVDSGEGLKKYFAAFHLHDTLPAAVVIDDFGDLFDERSCQEKYANPRGRDLAMVRTLALCHNAVLHAKRSIEGNCEVLLADTHHGDSPRLLYVYKRWVTSIFTIKGDGHGSFLLRDCGRLGSADSKKTAPAKYSTALQYLQLEGISIEFSD
ncbi:uncharacterized protein LOC116210341 isoform X2 [Punica granatum]|uniref:Uncharacterized protein n=2 Tax=Punica granatum TaxID=22663 RepID=A0A2I0KSI0_PUNGR|nr:uncharacterized protein LOC116210341 isoform X2 [Punica granatum]PKI71421.1 hypothetical protein CRG98_008200 [Punica granatum]